MIERILAEARDDHTLYLVAGLLASVTLVRLWAPEERRRLYGAVVMTGLHLLLVPIVGALRDVYPRAWRDTRIVLLIFTIFAVCGMASTVLFGVILPRLRLRAPPILRDVVTAGAALIAIFVAASRAGVNLSGLIATSAVLTAVIGFSLQDMIGNVVGGLALQLDNSIKVGDWIKVGDANGRVAEIRWRYTAIETRNWETIIVPNRTLLQSQVTVFGRRGEQAEKWRRWIWFNVDFRFPPSDVIDAVNRALQSAPIPDVAPEPKPHCVLMDFHESYARYAVRYWLSNLAADDPTDSAVRTRIYFALKRAGVPLSIPAHTIFMTEESQERREAKNRADFERRLNALRQVDLLASLGDDDLRHLADSLKYAPFARGEVITRQGAEAHWLYLVISGDVSVRVGADGGLEREVAQLKAGSFFGEMSLMTGERRSATVVALTDVECYRLEKHAFEKILAARPELAENFAEVLAKRRVELIAVREGLDAEAKSRRIAAAKSDLLGKIRDFFSLSGPGPGKSAAG